MQEAVQADMTTFNILAPDDVCTSAAGASPTPQTALESFNLRPQAHTVRGPARDLDRW